MVAGTVGAVALAFAGGAWFAGAFGESSGESQTSFPWGGFPAPGAEASLVQNSPLLAPTQPAPLNRPVFPWEPHRAVVVSINHLALLDMVFPVVEVAARYVDVIVVFPAEHPEVKSNLLFKLSKHPQGTAIRARVRFVPAAIASIWARDYCPLYAIGSAGKLVVIDPRTVDINADLPRAMRELTRPDPDRTTLYLRKVEETLGDDITPAYLASFLRTEYGYPAKIVRPPMFLDGGDFVLTAGREVILSESTLRYNGGQDDELRRIVRDYFGVKKVHFLDTLPGMTVDHLDFILNAIVPGVFLVAQPPERVASKQVYYDSLATELEDVLARNTAYLARAFPDHRLIRVPMPPPIVATREEILDRMRLEILREMCVEYGVDPAAMLVDDANDPKRLEAERKLRPAIMKDWGSLDMTNERDLARLSPHFLGQSLESLEEQFVGESLAFRTYLNSLLICAADGRRAVLIPRYKALSRSEQPLIERIEKEVTAAYAAAVPGADLVWIDCDDLIGGLGAIHCVTSTVPDFDAITSSTP